MSAVWWFLLVFGLTYLIVAAQITARIRHFVFALLGPSWGGWLACAPCTSFWVGITVGLWEPGIIDQLVPYAWQSPGIVVISSRLLGGILAMGAVAAFQFITHVPIAELGEEARDA